MRIFKKIKAIVQLVRVDLAFAAGICVIMGEIIAAGSVPSIYEMFLGFIAAFLISISVLVLNDYFDIETDKINRPTRPLPSGIIKPHEAILIVLIGMIVGFMVGFFIGYIALLVLVALWIVGFLYNWKFKKTGLPGNLMVSSSVAITFIFGGIVVGQPWNMAVWCFGLLAFFVDLGEEIAADAMDMVGDKKIYSNSIALTKGRENALKIAASMFAIVIVASFIPVIFRWLGNDYLLTILFMDSLIVFSTFKLLKSEKLAEGRFYIRLIYLGATFALVCYIAWQLII